MRMGFWSSFLFVKRWNWIRKVWMQIWWRFVKSLWTKKLTPPLLYDERRPFLELGRAMFCLFGGQQMTNFFKNLTLTKMAATKIGTHKPLWLNTFSKGSIFSWLNMTLWPVFFGQIGAANMQQTSSTELLSCQEKPRMSWNDWMDF